MIINVTFKKYFHYKFITIIINEKIKYKHNQKYF